MECLDYHVESIAQRIKAVLKVKGGQTWFKCGLPNKWPASVKLSFEFLGKSKRKCK